MKNQQLKMKFEFLCKTGFKEPRQHEKQALFYLFKGATTLKVTLKRMVRIELLLMI